ncbi:hypothetical protein ONE63_000894 [Megalurothrips usitatus]|uniref:Integrator complex subunit 1 n=1 Tax=Megalurothrips usitatus TaxID=439358 RepID=A0AAV7Y3V6_9NEOP|nr:hypothetical protein ONE63_000894 [Megalurothrips usitatus]
MDRGKSTSGRGGKSKTPLYPADLFALGSKQRVDSGDPKRPPQSHSKPVSSHGIPGASERKREATSSGISSMMMAKKQKVAQSGTILNRGVAGPPPSTSTPVVPGADVWETVAIETEPSELVAEVLKANDLGQTDKVVGQICGALRTIKMQRGKLDPCLYLSLLYLGKIRPSLMAMEPVPQALCSLLKRDVTVGIKSKNNPLVPILVTGLLMRAFNEKKHWPDSFVKLYIEDAVNERVWVDMEECKGFVENVITAFNTRLPTKSQLPPDLGLLPPNVAGLSSTCSSPSSAMGDDDGTMDIKEELGLNLGDSKHEFPVMPRYNGQQEIIESIVTEAIKEQVVRRQPPENTTRNFLRMLSATCGLVEVRLTAAQRLEMWLQNPKLTRPAQELLMYICVNCTTHTQRDVEVMSNIIKIRLKTKALINFYLSGIRELVSANPENLSTLMKHTVYNELSSSRNLNNMAVITTMFQISPENAPILLAHVLQEILMNREDYHRALRAFLRELTRNLRHDFDVNSFCRALMSDAPEHKATFRDFDFKERMYIMIVDLVCLCVFLAISPAVKEAASHIAKGDKKDIGVYHNFQMTIAKIQQDAMWWHHEIVLRLYRPSQVEYVHGIHKVMFMGPPDNYYKVDNWPQEGERLSMLRLASEIPLLQHTLMRILLIGLSKDHPMNSPETMELSDQLLKRASLLSSESANMLEANKVEIIDLIFNLSAYHHPENIILPKGYTPPHLAISNLYWKAWVMLLILATHNPTTFGRVAWEKYPTLRAFMEMCITNHFVYPPPSLGDHGDELRAREFQLGQLEKQQILEFESHLAAQSTKVAITEHTSLLLPQLITMDPSGSPRRPPPTVLEQLRGLNETHRMGHRLCRCRSPDFLVDIIQRQGASHSMPWLADLVESSEGALSHLPVQCLCEFLLSSTVDKQHKQQQLITHLRTVLMDPNQDPNAPCEVLEYFLRRLHSMQSASRLQAIKGLQLVMSKLEDEALVMDVDGIDREHAWLLRYLPQIPHFKQARPHVVQALRAACQVENETILVAAYISFLAQYALDDNLPLMTELTLDMATLIVERCTIMAALVPFKGSSSNETLMHLMKIFHKYLTKARVKQETMPAWSESQDILVTWSKDVQTTMHILVVHAMVILLSFGPCCEREAFDELLEAWFPQNGQYPKAFLIDTSEEALLYPDWLKLRMIRSEVEVLVEAALADLEPRDLVLFIQSFGIPVESMSRLLAALDQSVLLDDAAVANAVIDKVYMAQLVAVQRQRGATDGHMFVQVLQLNEPVLPAALEPPVKSQRDVLPIGSPVAAGRQLLQPQDVRPRLDEIFLSQVDHTVKIASCKLLQLTLAVELEQSPSESGVVAAVAEYFKSAFSSAVAAYLMSALFAAPQLSCPLFRIITANEKVSNYPPAILKLFLQSAKAMLHIDLPTKSPLTAILKHFVQKHEKENTDVGESLGVSKTIVKREARDSRDIVQCVTSALIQKSPSNSLNTGLLIDKLASMEPELIGSCPKLQMQLLFGRSTTTMSCRPYLLTLLIHRASWATLHRVVKHLLSTADPEYEPTAVLDFLWALQSNPKLWQGREKNTPKHYIPENVLCLSVNQLQSVVTYIVEEAAQDSADSLESRLPLLLQCTEENVELVARIVKHLLSIATDDVYKGVKSEMAHQFLLRLYFKIPGLIKYLIDIETDKFLEKASTTENGTSVLDRMSHLLLTALGAPMSKEAPRRSQEFEVAARKMASVHPALVLRQLPMVSSSLRGRSLLDYNVFRNRNHLAYFQHILGILELLQPYLFHRQHTIAFHGILDSYFSLFKNYGLTKDVSQILNRIITLMLSYVSNDGSTAVKYLQTHANLLRELQHRQPQLSSLCVLMSGVSMPRESIEESDIDGGDKEAEGGEVLVAVAAPLVQQEVDWRPLLQRLEQADGEEVNFALQEVEMVSYRQPAILRNFVEPIGALLLSPSNTLRSLAHNLLARYWKHDPSAAAGGAALRLISKCLDSNQPEVVATALDRLPDVVLSVQEDAVPLLQKVFALGMCSNINTMQHLSKALSLLNIQSGA